MTSWIAGTVPNDFNPLEASTLNQLVYNNINHLANPSVSFAEWTDDDTATVEYFSTSWTPVHSDFLVAEITVNSGYNVAVEIQIDAFAVTAGSWGALRITIDGKPLNSSYTYGDVYHQSTNGGSIPVSLLRVIQGLSAGKHLIGLEGIASGASNAYLAYYAKIRVSELS